MENTENRTYTGIPAGFAVRRSINKEYTYRVRPGNGHVGSEIGKIYQDKYPYFVPTSITNAAGQDARDALAAAVALWQSFTEAQRQAYNARAVAAKLHMSGYNLFIREYVKENA